MRKLILNNVSKSYAGIHAVDSVSFEVPQGVVYAIVGPNGAGKSTLLNLISGLDKPSTGRIFYNGHKISGLKPWVVAHNGIARLYQDSKIFNSLTLKENLIVAPKQRNPLPKNLEEKRNILLDAIEYSSRPQMLAGKLSYGQMKLLALARLINTHFTLLLLDEPTSGIHATLHSCIIELLRAWVSHGRSAILVEHNHLFVKKVADQILKMDSGKLITNSYNRHDLLR